MEPDRPRRSREHWAVLVLALSAPLALFVLGRFLEPDARGWGTHEQLGFQPCWPMTHWNVPCPGCGVTTAVSLAAHGRPLASLRTQPFGLVLLLASLAGAGWAALLHLWHRDLYAELHSLPWKRLAGALGTLLLLAWIYKLTLVRGWFGV